jgi:putative copper export protein
MWFYGGSFSTRVFVEYIPLFAILLGTAIHKIKRYKKSFHTVIILLIVLCQIQTYQYRYLQIHWSDMTKEKYWDVFLRIDRLQ